MIYVWGILLGLLGYAAIRAVRAYASAWLRREKIREKSIRGFYAAMKPLVEDEDTPTELLRVLSVLNQTISDPRIVQHLLQFQGKDRWWRRESRPTTLTKTATEFFAKRPELEEPFVRAIGEWLLAVTASSPVLGRVLRVSMSRDAIPEAAEAAAGKVGRGHGNGPDFVPAS